MAVNIKKDFGDTRRRPDVSSFIYGKVPPQAPELENAVLGAIIFEKERLEVVLAIIPSDNCFYVDANQKIYAAIRRLVEKGMPVDALTVPDELRNANELEIVGGAYYVAGLTRGVVSSANVEAHARIVMEKYLQRELIRISGEIISEAYEDTTDVFDLMDWAETALMANHDQILKTEATHIGSVAKQNTQTTEERRVSGNVLTGVTSGFAKLDKITNGWQKTDLIILAARPAVGKTAFCLNLAMNAGVPVLFFSLEMPKTSLEMRLRSAKSGVNMDVIQRPVLMTEHEYTQYLEAEQQIFNLKIFIDDKGGATSMEVRAKARNMKKKHGIQLIVIDYIQLMRGDKKSGNREQEISTISRDLKALAKELELPIIALSQLNREVENRNPPIPRISDLRESGAIEQDADVVMLMYRAKEDDEEKDPSLRGPVIIDIPKHRNGSTDKTDLYFRREIQKWYNDNPDDPFIKSHQEYMDNNPRAGFQSYRPPYKED